MRKKPSYDPETVAQATRLEEAISANEPAYFDLETYEEIIAYYFDQAKYPLCLRICDHALRQHPSSVELMLAKANVLSILDRTDEAFELAQRAALFSPNSSEVQQFYGGLYALQGQYEEALRHWEAALPLAENPAEVLYGLGFACQSLGRYDEAIDYYRRSVTEDPSFEDAVHELAFCLENHGEKTLQPLLDLFEEMIDRNAFDKHAWYNKGIIYGRLMQYKEALHCFDFAVIIDDKFADAHFNKANTHMNLLEYALAVEGYQRVIELEGGDAEVFCHLGAAKEYLQEYTQALKYYKKALAEDPQYADAWYGAGVCFNEMERWLEALHHLKKAIEHDDTQADYWLELADVEQKMGNLMSAEEAFLEAHRRDPENPGLWLDWSMMYLREHEIDKAIRLIKEGLEELPSNADLHYRSCAYHLVKGHFQEACSALQFGLILDYDRHEVLFEFFPSVEMHKAIIKLIQQFKD